VDAESARAVTGAIALTLFVLSLTVFATALVTKGPDQEPNSLIGIKTRATKSSKEAWVAGHRAAYPYMMTGATHCLASSALIAGLLALGSVPATAMLTLGGPGTRGSRHPDTERHQSRPRSETTRGHRVIDPLEDQLSVRFPSASQCSATFFEGCTRGGSPGILG